MGENPIVLMSIVKDGLASKFVEEARKAGSKGATIIRANGTVNSKWMNLLGIHDVDREIVLSVIPADNQYDIQKHVYKKMELDKDGKGVMFTFNTSSCYGNNAVQANLEEEVENMPGHQLVVTIVERGLGDEVVETARDVGAVGATIVHGRGVGSHENSRLFNIQIEPEKEIVFMVVENEHVDEVNQAISKDLKINEPGHGLLFTMDVNQASGLFEEN